MGQLLRKLRACPAIAAAIMTLTCENAVLAQIPGLPAPAPQPNTAGKVAHGSLEEKGAVAASSGPINLKDRVADDTLQRFLARFLPKYPGVRNVNVAVDQGVVTLQGRVDDDDSRDEITDVVRRVEGVLLVLNQMNIDDEVMTAWEVTAQEVKKLGDYLARKWLLMLLALSIVGVSMGLARLFAANAETLLAPFVPNALLRSVVGSLISGLLAIGGILLALGAMRLTQAVLSILGLSAVVGLAVGFAFRDITENFIASVLLGMRRPFQIGDYVTVAGQSGVVKSLNTRATVLVTLEGNHVRIPNAVIFKEIMVNSTASPFSRNTFDVVIPNSASTVAAIDAITRALSEQKGVLHDPPPRALVEALEPDGVRVRAYLWAPTQGVDWSQLLSDSKLKAKVALQEAGIVSPAANAKPAGASNQTEGVGPHRPIATSGQARSNLARDSHAAANGPPDGEHGVKPPMVRALEQPETRVSEEGANLLSGHKSE